jgi:hypothetical protein
VPLFETDRLPEGFWYRTDFITADEQRALVAAIEQIEFSTFEMRGVVARRRVAFFGQSYTSGEKPQGPIPGFLSHPADDRAPIFDYFSDPAGRRALDTFAAAYVAFQQTLSHAHGSRGVRAPRGRAWHGTAHESYPDRCRHQRNRHRKASAAPGPGVANLPEWLRRRPRRQIIT